MEIKPYSKKIRLNPYSNKFIYEEEGGGDGSDGGSESPYSSNYSGGFHGSYGDLGYYGYHGGGGGGGSHASVKEFYEGLVVPVKELLRMVFGYGVERISNTIYYAAKKIIVNIPRMFNPATPLIFDDIKDEEKAAYERIDNRYADTLKEVNSWAKNKDLKAITFMLYPTQIISGLFVKNAPKLAYKTANVLSGNKIQDFVSRVKEAYYKLPSQQRSRRRIAELIKRYEEEDRKAALKIYGKSSIAGKNQYSSYDYDYLEEEKSLDKKILSNANFYPIALELFPEVFQEILKEPFEEIKNSGEIALENIVNTAKANVIRIKKVMKSKDLNEFSSATGINKLEIIKSIEDSTENVLTTKVKEFSRMEDDKKEELKEIISTQIYNQTFNLLKKDYLSKQNLYSIKLELQPLIDDPFIPKYIKQEVEDLLREI